MRAPTLARPLPGDLRSELFSAGSVPVESISTADDCERIREFIDEFDDRNSEINYAGTEKRIWQAHRHLPEIAAVKSRADALISRIFETTIASRDVLAIRNLPVDQTPDLQRGRWHLDSLRRQVKVFLFLSDVGEGNGPLEIVPRSQAPLTKARHALAGHSVRPTDFLGTSRKYQQLDDAWVDGIVNGAGGSRALECRAGDAFVVDTSAIHRARPCVEGRRYALTVYYDHF